MAVPKKLAGMKRFGPRYGRSLKQKFIEVENLQRKKYKCPYCAHEKVKRESLGIWQCGKCNAKFASKAYTIPKKKATKEAAQEIEIAEVPEEVEEDQEEDIIEKIPK